MKKVEKTFDIATGEETIIERDETAAEKKLREKHEAEIAAQIAEADAQAIAKSALLDRMGLTADEAKLLLS